LGLFCLLPLLEAVNALIKFAWRKDVFICAFVAIVKLYQVDIFMMYFGVIISYQCEHFFVMWTIVLPLSPKIGLLISTLVQKTLHFTWLIIYIKLTFSV
jgi:hypothetical protein